MLSPESLDLLKPVKSEEFLPSISRWTTFGGLAVVGVFGVAVLLAAATPYRTIVKAPAVVRPTGETRFVQVAVAGTVRQILVKEGDLVQQGSAIAVLDTSQLHTQQQQLIQAIQTTQQQLQQIESQMQSLDQQIRAESRLVNHSIAVSQADLLRSEQEYRSQKRIAQAQVQEAEAVLELAQTEMQKYQQLAHTGAITELQLQEKVQVFKAAEARLAQAEANLNPSHAAVTIATENMAQDRARGESTIAALHREQQSLMQQQLDLRKQLDRDQTELPQLEHNVAQSTLKATIQGKILKLALRNMGQVVSEGETIAQIVPTQTPLVVKARVPAAEIANVQVCQANQVVECATGQVQMRISAYPYPDYGTLSGIVKRISADAIVSATETSYYEVIIQPDRSYLQRQNRRYQIQPGMELDAEITSTPETVLTLILRKARLLLRL